MPPWSSAERVAPARRPPPLRDLVLRVLARAVRAGSGVTSALRSSAARSSETLCPSLSVSTSASPSLAGPVQARRPVPVPGGPTGAGRQSTLRWAVRPTSSRRHHCRPYRATRPISNRCSTRHAGKLSISGLTSGNNRTCVHRTCVRSCEVVYLGGNDAGRERDTSSPPHRQRTPPGRHRPKKRSGRPVRSRRFGRTPDRFQPGAGRPAPTGERGRGAGRRTVRPHIRRRAAPRLRTTGCLRTIRCSHTTRGSSATCCRCPVRFPSTTRHRNGRCRSSVWRAPDTTPADPSWPDRTGYPAAPGGRGGRPAGGLGGRRRTADPDRGGTTGRHTLVAGRPVRCVPRSAADHRADTPPEPSVRVRDQGGSTTAGARRAMSDRHPGDSVTVARSVPATGRNGAVRYPYGSVPLPAGPAEVMRRTGGAACDIESDGIASGPTSSSYKPVRCPQVGVQQPTALTSSHCR